MKYFIEDELLNFGFTKNSDSFVYKKLDENLDLIFIVTIDNNENLTVLVKDALTDEEFRLHLSPKAKGEYVQSVRNKILELENSIKSSCTKKYLFSYQWQKICDYIKEHYDACLECLWKEKFNSDEGIFRRHDNQKWFAALLVCNKKTLTGSGVGTLEVINIRVDPDKLDSIVDNKLFFKGYHMNKKNWISIVLNEGCELETIYAYIDESYRLNGLKKSKSKA